MRNYYLILDGGVRRTVLAASAEAAVALHDGPERIWAVIDTWLLDGETAVLDELTRVMSQAVVW
ncbi:hypothetical protein [Tsukamurella hominis]|uniref:hypothetical protein n=1 Tax=Tsukamurella hominis TaxID=1970232 RepID=UPI0039E87A3B